VATALPAFHSQERHALRCLASVLGSVDFYGRRCAALEKRIATLPDGPARRSLLAELFATRQEEAKASTDLRDLSSYLVGLIPPLRND
jgi:hypothetical protein